MLTDLPDIQTGRLALYQLYDLGEAIDLELAQTSVAEPQRYTLGRVRQSESIQIAQAPIRVKLGAVSVMMGDISLCGRLRGSIYDLGAVALVMELHLPQPTNWQAIADLHFYAQEPPQEVQNYFFKALSELKTWLQQAISQPRHSSIVEDYSILFVEQLAEKVEISALAEHPAIAAALLGEKRSLSPQAALSIASMSYYPDDLALLSWNGALLIEPDPLAAATAADLIEFANVELLLMRAYDADLDALLPSMYRRIAQAQPNFALPLVRRYSKLLRDVQRLVAEVTEVTERVDNALKVTEDVYWNRLYSSMVNVLRVNVWRSGVEHKLALLRQTYTMLHAEAEAERASALELIIILLIMFEIIMALLGH